MLSILSPFASSNLRRAARLAPLPLGLVLVALSACSGESDGSSVADAPDSGGSSSSTSSGGSSSGASSSSSSTSSSSSSSSGSTDAGDTCNDVTQLGSSVPLLTTKSSAPAATGGTLADGTWVLVDAKIWGSTAPEGTKVGTAGSSTIRTKGTSLELVVTGATSGKVTRRNATLTLSDDTFHADPTCAYPAADAGAETLFLDGTYTAEATKLHLYQATNDAVLEFAFEKK